MSIGIKRNRAAALADAIAFRDLFAGCFEEWIFGGSIRRLRDEVCDLDHIVRPKWVDVAGDGLFAEPKKVNLGLRNKDGRVWECVQCPREGKCDKSCPECQGTRLKTVKVIPVPTEEFYFELCGVAWVPPEERSL